MIDIRKITKQFGAFTAVKEVSFQVQRGEVLGFLGPNGAGKSTTMKMITGFLTPTSGTALVGGHDVLDNPIAVKRALGYLPEGAPAYPDMTPASFLGFVAAVRGVPRRQRKEHIHRAASRVHLEGVMHQSIETLSKGYKRRVGLAQAILHDPEVLIMDEPTDGLDPNQKHEVRALIQEMSARKAIVLSTHILEEVEAVCTRAIIVNRGRIVADGTPDQLRSRSRYHNAVAITVRVMNPGMVGAIRAELGRAPNVDGVEDVSMSDGRASFTVMPKAGRTILAEVGLLARSKAWEVDELRVQPGRLDEVFRAVTTGSAPARNGGAS